MEPLIVVHLLAKYYGVRHTMTQDGVYDGDEDWVDWVIEMAQTLADWGRRSD